MKYKKELDSESKIAKYKNLVGKYLYKAPNIYKKIVSIDRVSAGECWDVIHYTSVTVIYDMNTPFAKIQLSNYGLIEDFEIEEHLTNKENFEKAYQNCMDLIKKFYEKHLFGLFLLIFAIVHDTPTGYEQ